MALLDKYTFERTFTYHPPIDPKTRAAHDAARAAFKNLAHVVNDTYEPHQDDDEHEIRLALEHLQMSEMWVHAYIARNDSRQFGGIGA